MAMSVERKISIMSILLEINDFDEHEDTHPRGPDRKWMRGRSEKGALL